MMMMLSAVLGMLCPVKKLVKQLEILLPMSCNHNQVATNVIFEVKKCFSQILYYWFWAVFQQLKQEKEWEDVWSLWAACCL